VPDFDVNYICKKRGDQADILQDCVEKETHKQVREKELSEFA
jgi:hypothetical protein